MPGCSTMRQASKIFSLWSSTADFFALACQGETPHQGRQQVRNCEGRGFLLIIWKGRSVLGQIRAVAFLDIRLDRKGNCIFVKINNQFTS